MITTVRLTVRRIQKDDWQSIREIWQKIAKTEYAQYDEEKDTEEQAVKNRIATWASFSDSHEHMFFAVVKDSAVIGYISLNRNGIGYEIGYGFSPDVWGHGYARESISALLKNVDANVVIAGTGMKNTPSVRLLKSLGFFQYGTEDVSFYKDHSGNRIWFSGGIFVYKKDG